MAGATGEMIEWPVLGRFSIGYGLLVAATVSDCLSVTRPIRLPFLLF
jgi:hypothetical protein